GGRTSRGRLSHHSHPPPPHGEIAAGARLCGGDDSCSDHSSRQLLRDSPLYHACHLHFHHGCRRCETFQRNEVDCRRANYLGLGFHAACQRFGWLRTCTRDGGGFLTVI